MGIVYNKKRNSYSFTELLNGLYKAVNSAQELLEVQQIKSFKKYFDQEGQVLIEKIDPGTGKKMTVPLISLIPQNTLVMEEVEVEFDARLQEVAPGTIEESQLAATVANSELELGMNSKKNSDMIHVKVKFKSADATEGLNCVIDECNKMI